MRAFVMIVVVAVAAGCSRGGEPSAATPQHADGTERGDCYGNGTCNAGLACMSGLCVRPPEADCTAIVAHLSGLLLDNYTPRADRDRWTATTTAECEDAHLTKAEGDCLLGETVRNRLGRCPKKIGIGDCTAIVAFVHALPGNDPDLKTDADRVADRCRNEVPSRAFETCALAARSVDDLARCAW